MDFAVVGIVCNMYNWLFYGVIHRSYIDIHRDKSVGELCRSDLIRSQYPDIFLQDLLTQSIPIEPGFSH